MGEAITCPLCEHGEDEPVIEEGGFTGRQCASCGLIFISPRPKRQEMDALYESGDAYLSPDFFIARTNSLSERLAVRDALRQVRRHASSGSLLEIGPGNGAFLAHARGTGFQVFGVDLNPSQAQFVRTHHGVPCATTLEGATGLGPETFDVVYHRDVLSHFYDPISEFQQIHDLLRGGGYHIFETGNLGDVAHHHFARVSSFQYPDHLFFYSERSILKLLARTGFKHVCTYRHSTLYEQMLRAQVTRLRRAVTRQSSGSEPRAERSDRPAAVGNGLGRRAREAMDVIYYGIRHTVGPLAASERAPQTITVVARKPA